MNRGCNQIAVRSSQAGEVILSQDDGHGETCEIIISHDQAPLVARWITEAAGGSGPGIKGAPEDMRALLVNTLVKYILSVEACPATEFMDLPKSRTGSGIAMAEGLWTEILLLARILGGDANTMQDHSNSASFPLKAAGAAV